jgi:Holliday junction resolvasome RuvABC ATP-dependent DNA helicase subunit
VEPYLLSAGLLKRTARGRKATRLAYQHVAALKEKDLELFATAAHGS